MQTQTTHPLHTIVQPSTMPEAPPLPPAKMTRSATKQRELMQLASEALAKQQQAAPTTLPTPAEKSVKPLIMTRSATKRELMRLASEALAKQQEATPTTLPAPTEKGEKSLTSTTTPPEEEEETQSLQDSQSSSDEEFPPTLERDPSITTAFNLFSLLDERKPTKSPSKKSLTSPPMPMPIARLRASLNETPTGPHQSSLPGFAANHTALFFAHFDTLLNEHSQPIDPAIRTSLRERMELVTNHLFSASQNMENLYEAVMHGEIDCLPSIISSLLADWHVQIEQYMTIPYILRELSKGPTPLRTVEKALPHSLCALHQSINQGKTQSPTAASQRRTFLENISRGLIWYRYPVQSLSKFRHERDIPPILKLFRDTSTGNIPTQNLIEALNYVCETHKACYQFLYDQIKEQAPHLPPIFAQFDAQIEALKVRLQAAVRAMPPPATTPLPPSIQKLHSFFAQHGGKMSQEARTHTHEYLLHHDRMRATFRMIDRAMRAQREDFLSTYMSRLLNFQWMTEEFYNIRLLLEEKVEKQEHEFTEYEKESPFVLYNVAKRAHYETKGHHQSSGSSSGTHDPIKDLQSILSFCREQALANDGFQTTKKTAPKEVCREKIDYHKHQIEQFLTLQENILVETFTNWAEKLTPQNSQKC